MTTDYIWQKSYLAALLETDWTTMRDRLQTAEAESPQVSQSDVPVRQEYRPETTERFRPSYEAKHLPKVNWRGISLVRPDDSHNL